MALEQPKFDNIVEVETSKFLMDNYNNCNSAFAVAVQYLLGSDLSLHLLSQINSYTNPYCDISLITLNKTPTIIYPTCAVFGYSDIVNYQYPLIATDIPTWQATLGSPSLNKYLYLYDVYGLQKLDKALIKKINDSGYKIFSRTKDHKNFLEKIGLKLLNHTVELPTMEKFIEVINGQ